jgi:hypothetical protein
MVFEVIDAQAPAGVLSAGALSAVPLSAGALSAVPLSGSRPDLAAGNDPDDRPAAPTPVRRAVSAGVLGQLLRSAVALQAEGLLRTAGALSGAWGGVLDRTEWIERDARDLGALAAAATAAGARLPAGVDTGAGDPDHPISVVESMLAGHEALVTVLRQLTGSGRAPHDAGAPCSTDADSQPAEQWRRVALGILRRREQEIVLLRAIGATGDLPAEPVYLRGVPPRA